MNYIILTIQNFHILGKICSCVGGVFTQGKKIIMGRLNALRKICLCPTNLQQQVMKSSDHLQ